MKGVWKSLLCPVALSLAVGCSHKPPPDFAPDPGLLSHIREIQIKTTVTQACPGTAIAASYDAVLDDGTHVPFLRSYDKKHPPRLHVVFLEFSSSEANSSNEGTWVLDPDPLLSAASGFQLHVSLRAKPSIQGTATVAPDYSCSLHSFGFAGEQGGPGQAGGNGPDVTVRIGRGHSSFYDRLLVVGIQVGMQAPYYALYDARSIPPADFLIVESRGGRGGGGTPGPKGAARGETAATGVPARPAGAGAPSPSSYPRTIRIWRVSSPPAAPAERVDREASAGPEGRGAKVARAPSGVTGRPASTVRTAPPAARDNRDRRAPTVRAVRAPRSCRCRAPRSLGRRYRPSWRRCSGSRAGVKPEGLLATAAFDVIVIGAGHNGLVTAAYLARAGRRVLVLERRGMVGGACVTEEVWPGYRVSTAAYVNSLLRPEIIRDLELTRHGFALLPRDPSSFTPFPDGRYLLLGPDKELVRRQVAKFSRRDAERLPQYEAMLERVAAFIEPTLLAAPPDPWSLRPGDLLGLARLGWRFLKLGADGAQAIEI